MAWWDHEELKDPENRSNHYKIIFNGEYEDHPDRRFWQWIRQKYSGNLPININDDRVLAILKEEYMGNHYDPADEPYKSFAEAERPKNMGHYAAEMPERSISEKMEDNAKEVDMSKPKPQYPTEGYNGRHWAMQYSDSELVQIIKDAKHILKERIENL